MDELRLNREQIRKLAHLTKLYKDVEHFTITTNNYSGIGVSTFVKFTELEENDNTVDITDYSEW